MPHFVNYLKIEFINLRLNKIEKLVVESGTHLIQTVRLRNNLPR
jgi:hypothetical protein